MVGKWSLNLGFKYDFHNTPGIYTRDVWEFRKKRDHFPTAVFSLNPFSTGSLEMLRLRPRPCEPLSYDVSLGTWWDEASPRRGIAVISILVEMATSPRNLQENGAVWWHCCHSGAVRGAAATLPRTTQPARFTDPDRWYLRKWKEK